MDSEFLTFAKKLLFFSFIICGLAIPAFFLLPAKIITPTLPFLLPYFFAITLLTYYFQLKAVHKTFIKFTNNFCIKPIRYRSPAGSRSGEMIKFHRPPK